MDLFSAQTSEKGQPLAYRMRPRILDEYIGQDHIVGPGRLLRRIIQADRLSSLIFYGPPGTGKTTLARVIAGSTKSAFLSLNAVLSGVKQLREAIEQAKQKKEYFDQRTILFIDEVHRWNKAQQDALLPSVESGDIVLIGATTENPYFEVIPALVSRSRVFQLKQLSEENLRSIARQALLDKERGYGRFNVQIDEEALDHLVSVAGGDARSLLNALELAVETTPEHFPPDDGTLVHVTLDAAEESIQQKVVLYDKEGDYHFDTISAFIKSLRGSDPDAALYWLALMVRAGENPRFIFRRMLISACEDVGLADPQALVVVEAAAAAFDRVGLPEGQYHLTHAALYLATAPKSNSSLAYFDALKSVEEESSEVPNHLKDASRDGKEFGHGQGYIYPHAYRDHWAAQQYLPDGLKGRVFYNPSECGFEGDIREEVLRKREIQLETAAVPFDEVLTWSPEDKGREQWIRRLQNHENREAETIREQLFSLAAPRRHDRILDLRAGRGVLTWEALRQVPEGGVWSIYDSETNKEILEHYALRFDEDHRPQLIKGPWDTLTEKQNEGIPPIDLILARNIPSSELPDLPDFCKRHASKKGRLCIAQNIPAAGTRLSSCLLRAGWTEDEVKPVLSAEEELLGPVAASDKDIVAGLEHQLQAKAAQSKVIRLPGTRVFRKKELENWLAPGGPYEKVQEETGTAQTIVDSLDGKSFNWQGVYLFLAVEAGSF